MTDSQNKSTSAQEHLDRAYALEEQGDFVEGLEECEAAVEAAWRFVADAHNMRGILLEGLGRKREAFDAYEQAITLDPALREALDNLQTLAKEIRITPGYETVGRFPEAEAQLAGGKLEAEGIPALVIHVAPALPPFSRPATAAVSADVAFLMLIARIEGVLACG